MALLEWDKDARTNDDKDGMKGPQVGVSYFQGVGLHPRGPRSHSWDAEGLRYPTLQSDVLGAFTRDHLGGF